VARVQEGFYRAVGLADLADRFRLTVQAAGARVSPAGRRAFFANLPLTATIPSARLGGQRSPCPSAAAESTILIVSSGNDGLDSGADDGLPESHPRVITVAGTDIFDQRASFSDCGTKVDFSAPAVGILTSDILGVDPFRSNVDDDPDFADGTSWAAPMVTAIALMGLAVRPQMTLLELYTALRETAVDLGAPGKDPCFGRGRVDAYGAVLMLKEQLLFVDDFETGDTSRWQ
jgi:hypothetical protein